MVSAKWTELQAHASFPDADTNISQGTVTTPAGTFDCWAYTVTRREAAGKVVETFYFAKAQVKTFSLDVRGGKNGDLGCGLHEYIYNYGVSPIRIEWSDAKSAELPSGGSAYVSPAVSHRLEPLSDRPGQVLVARIPGGLTSAALDEFATYDTEARRRAIWETERWF